MESLCHLHLHCGDKPCYCKIQNISVLSSASFVVNDFQRHTFTSLPRKKKGGGRAICKKQCTSLTVEFFTDTFDSKILYMNITNLLDEIARKACDRASPECIFPEVHFKAWTIIFLRIDQCDASSSSSLLRWAPWARIVLSLQISNIPRRKGRILQGSQHGWLHLTV